MQNVILNVDGNDDFQALTAAVGFPFHARRVTIQARTSAVVDYRYIGQTAYYTVKAGDPPRELLGEYSPDELEVRAAVGVVIEIECNCQLTV